jgi:hypothetical protein
MLDPFTLTLTINAINIIIVQIDLYFIKKEMAKQRQSNSGYTVF